MRNRLMRYMLKSSYTIEAPERITWELPTFLLENEILCTGTGIGLGFQQGIH